MADGVNPRPRLAASKSPAASPPVSPNGASGASAMLRGLKPSRSQKYTASPRPSGTPA